VEEVLPLIGPWLAAAGQCVAVVRPDHHVYGAAAHHADALRMLSDLQHALL
jgi:hypothetical protein